MLSINYCEFQEKESANILQTLILSVSIILIMNVWSYVPYLQTDWCRTYIPRLLFFVFLLIIILKKTQVKYNEFDKLSMYIIITLLISSIPAFFEYQQTFFSSLSIISYYFYGFLLYIVLRKFNYSTKMLIKIVGIVSLVWVALELVQQLTYPVFYFSGRYLEENLLEKRMGFMRFYIWGVDFVMIAFSYYYGLTISEYKNSSVKIKTILVAFFLMCGLLCYGSRKHIYVVLIIVLLSFFNVDRRKKWLMIILLGVFFYYLYTEFYLSFYEMNNEISQTQGDGEDFIRVLEAQYFLFDFSDSPLYPLWGAGIDGATGSLAYKIEMIHERFSFYQSDCGIIGYYSQTGLLGISAVAYYIYLVIHNWRFIDLEYRYFFVMKMLLLFFDFWAMWNVGMAAYAVYLYLLNKNIKKNKAIRFYN